MEQVIANMEVEIPEDMVDYQADKLVEDYARRITAQGIPYETYLSMMGMTPAAMKEQAKESARRQVQVDLALRAVAAAEGIQVTDEDKEKEIQQLAEQYSMTVEQVKSVVVEKELEADLCKQKAADLIFESAKAEKPAAKKTAKKSAKKEEAAEEAGEGEEKKPAKKTTRKTAKKTEEAGETGEDTEKKPAKKTSAKKTAKKDEE